MTRLALRNSQRTRLAEHRRALAAGRKPRFPTRAYNRCQLCARRHGYMRFFGICRICFRELAVNGDIPGITKSSW